MKSPQLDQIIANKEELIRDVKVRSSIGCSVHKVMKFSILGEGSRAKSKIIALDFRRADLQPLQRPAWANPMEYDPGEKRG